MGDHDLAVELRQLSYTTLSTVVTYEFTMTARPENPDGQTRVNGELLFRCPDCNREFTWLSGVLTCQDCGYVPRQGAD